MGNVMNKIIININKSVNQNNDVSFYYALIKFNLMTLRSGLDPIRTIDIQPESLLRWHLYSERSPCGKPRLDQCNVIRQFSLRYC